MKIEHILLAIACAFCVATTQAEPLSSWNDTASKQAIVSFVKKITTPGSSDFVPVAERIATFDNDGTLWCEQPLYVQLQFAIDRVKALAPQHPEWRQQQPFKKLFAATGDEMVPVTEAELLQMVIASHAGMTTDEFDHIVSEWLARARHPKTGRLYTEMVYQPMLELLAFLRANGFKTYIVSGGGIEFMRPWTETVYGIPPEQVVGSGGKLKYELLDGNPVLRKLPEISFIDDKAGKPVGIQTHIGRRPIAAFGNSDGDFEMLEWTTTGRAPSFGLLVHHDDAEREYAYDRDSHIGKLDRGLNEAVKRGWIVVSMEKDWKTIYPAAAR